jgi:hypothetical protein
LLAISLDAQSANHSQVPGLYDYVRRASAIAIADFTRLITNDAQF